MDPEMVAPSASSPLIKQGRTLIIFLVVAGYILTFLTAAWGETHFSALKIVFGVLFGICYVILGMFDVEILRFFSPRIQLVLLFSIQIGLVFGIGWMLGPGGTWLIGLPIASLAVERLTPPWRWPVYITLLAAIVLPIIKYSTLETAGMNAIIIATGIFFVVFTSQLRLNEQRARKQAEDLARELESTNHKLAEYASQVEKLAITQERNRLAREIHDSVGHYLTIINVQLEVARLTISTNPAHALDALTKAEEQTRKGLSAVRESVTALRISPVENRSLEEAIAELVNESIGAGIKARLSIIGNSRPIETKMALVFYRAVQEGLTNVRKHAPEASVEICLDFSHESLMRLRVKDDGPGTDETSHGFGLVGMRERVQLLGGELTIETAPNQGFCLDISIPVVDNL